MAEDPARAAAVADVIHAVFAALDDPTLTKADINAVRDPWPFDGLQLAAYKLEFGSQAQSMGEIKDFAKQVVKLRDDMQEVEEWLREDPDDEGAKTIEAKLKEDEVKYRRMAESFFRGGMREHIKDMK
jgi:hypothetical protein